MEADALLCSGTAIPPSLQCFFPEQLHTLRVGGPHPGGTVCARIFAGVSGFLLRNFHTSICEQLAEVVWVVTLQEGADALCRLGCGTTASQRLEMPFLVA